MSEERLEEVWPFDEAITRRRLLRAGLAAGVGLSAASFLSACSDTTVPGGQSPHKAPGRPAACPPGQPGDAADLPGQQADPLRDEA